MYQSPASVSRLYCRIADRNICLSHPHCDGRYPTSGEEMG
ncbi:hypothetical protein CKAH01_13819 [Colletotrichum kahawae]|uniref:Uncharacterized protein n=1 Tax=Colletotrichum kahawae TaxID=34407 RepID=A0AAD9YM40_COLKA|nr:hypothetical protein CKAH01_13819 [Colletotrichum kahawae]